MTYYVKVRAANRNGFGFASPAEHATTLAGVPSQPANLLVDSNDKGNMVLRWSPPIHNGGSDVSEYEVHMAEMGLYTGCTDRVPAEGAFNIVER